MLLYFEYSFYSFTSDVMIFLGYLNDMLELQFIYHLYIIIQILICNIMIQSQQNLTKNLQNNALIKKTKKIKLTGLAIPISGNAIKKIHHKPSPKQQSIQKSSSSSEQQTFYQNYLLSSLQEVIQKLIGSDVQYSIDQLKQSQIYKSDNSSDVQYVDIVIKVKVNVQAQTVFHDRIRKIKQNQMQKRIQKDQNKRKKQFNTKSLQKFIRQEQSLAYQIEPQTSKGFNFQYQKSDDEGLDSQAQVKSKRNRGRLRDVNQSYQQINIKDNSSLIVFDDKVLKNKGKNKKYNKVLQRQYYQQRKKQQNNKGSTLKCKRIIIYLGILFAICLLLLGFSLIYLKYSKIQRPKNNKQQQYIQSKKQKQNFTRLQRDNFFIKFPKQNFMMPSIKQDEGLKDIRLYVQTLPPVNHPSQSLDQRCKPYIRPTTTYLYTFVDMNSNQISIKRKSSYILNFTYRQQQINKYLEKLNKQKLPQSLYTKIKNSPEDQLLIQAQYIYIQNKYNISKIQTLIQKHLCIVSIGRNMYQSKSFVPFFESVIAQNYSNYKLIYIDDGSEDEYEVVRIMNYLSNNFYQIIAIIQSNKFFFLRNQITIGKTLAKNAAIRQFCGDNDVIVDIDANNQIIGRQTFKVISKIYNPRSSYVILTEQQARKIQNNKQIIKKQQRKYINQTKNNQLNIVNQTGVNDIWVAYTNYFYQNKQIKMINKNKNKNKQYQQGFQPMFKESQRQIMQKYQLFRKMQNNTQFIKQVTKKISSLPEIGICLKTYLSQLQYKINNQQLTLNFFKSPQNQYNSDDYIFTSLLQMSGNFDQKKQMTHFRSIQQPFCLRNPLNLNKCAQAKKNFEQIKSFSRNSFQQLITIKDNIKIIQNKVKGQKQFILFMNQMKRKMQVECLNERNSEKP